MVTVLTGLAAGFVHVFSGPDHLAALSPLSVVEKRMAWLSGLKWGLGHTTGVLMIGALALIFREILPVESVSSFSERLVGVVLIGIGVWGLLQSNKSRIHSHVHEHDGVVHEHIHTHGHPHSHAVTHRHSHAAVFIGMLHGTAGGSHLLGVLPALVFVNIADSIIYLLAFGAGTVAAMVAFTLTLGVLSSRLGSFGFKRYKLLLVSLSVATIFLGGFWLFQT